MDDRRILAEMERRLARDDPELVALMDALNLQFPDGDEHTESRSDDGGPHDWRWKAMVVFALVLVVGLILTAVFSRSPSTDGNHGPPNGRAPVVSVQGRGSRLGRAPRRRPATRHERPSTDLWAARSLPRPLPTALSWRSRN
ncbi:hypothetical protein GCM10027074_35870 [Streptomyces deserti]